MGNVKLKRNQQIDLKLIALIKPHEMLYRRAKRGDDLEFRSKLWDKISATMNASFKLKRSAAEWRTRFRSLRKVYGDVIHSKKIMKNTVIIDQLDFLRPLIGTRNDFKEIGPRGHFHNHVDVKLIQLIRPRKALYDTAARNGNSAKHQHKLWTEICAEMNETFGRSRKVDEWKIRWESLKLSYSETDIEQQSPIIRSMDFMRPYLRATDSRTAMKTRQQESPSQSSCDEPIVVDAPESESDFQLFDGEATNDGCFEILKIDDDDDHDDDGGIYYEFPVGDIVNDSPVESFDGDDDDRAFGALIAGELRKMSPAAQQAFKRNVSELMYA